METTSTRAKTSPTARAMERCRKLGWAVCKTEHRVAIPGSKHSILRDLWGFVDMVALRTCVSARGIEHEQYVHIQVTSGTNLSSRAKKIMGEECVERALRLLRVPGVAVEVWGWRQLSKETATKLGNARQTWWAKRLEVYLQDGELTTRDLEDL